MLGQLQGLLKKHKGFGLNFCGKGAVARQGFELVRGMYAGWGRGYRCPCCVVGYN